MKLDVPKDKKEESQDKHNNDTSIGGIIGGAYGPSPASTMNSNETQKSEDIFHTAELPDLSPEPVQNHSPESAELEPKAPSNDPLPPAVKAPAGKPESDTQSSEISFNPTLTSSPVKQPKKQAVFADTQELPLISDNEGGQWRQSKSYVPATKTQEQKGVKHVPFDAESEKSSASKEEQQKEAQFVNPLMLTH